MPTFTHLPDELSKTKAEVVAETRFGPVRGGRARNGCAVFLEVPYAEPPIRFQNSSPLPAGWKYEDKLYTQESAYAFQPHNDGQAAGNRFEDKVGYGQPTENPLFVNIVSPPAFPANSGFPVKVYIHGGFLQFGSPHALSSQAQHVALERSEVWVNIGYRLSAFGFLASDEPKVDGNFGFKDQWLALAWIKENISAFGGNPDNIQLTGLSAGAHSVHQILHHVSRLPAGEVAPFHSAVLQSNSILLPPRTPAEFRPQFQALCRAVKLDPSDPDVLSKLRDPSIVLASEITRVIETEEIGSQYGAFRGCLDGDWLAADPDPMEWQRNGGFARGLKEHGVRTIIVGDLSEEWYLYSIAYPVNSMRDIAANLEQYYQRSFVEKIMQFYPRLPDGATTKECERLFGDILSDGQVYLPVRLLARDLVNADFPVLRYHIKWTPEQVRPLGYVTHATDRPLWAFLRFVLADDQVPIAREWLETIARETAALDDGSAPKRSAKDVLVLTEDRKIRWEKDERWEHLMRLKSALPGET